jgi:hypothetical protein
VLARGRGRVAATYENVKTQKQKNFLRISYIFMGMKGMKGIKERKLGFLRRSRVF